MSDIKKYRHWLKEITNWQKREGGPLLSIHLRKSTRKLCHLKTVPKRYYVDKSRPELYLTPREYEIVILLIQNKGYKAIAKELSLSPRSVEYYIQNIRLKFHRAKQQ